MTLRPPNQAAAQLKSQWLEHFIALSDAGGFRAAATTLGVSRQTLQRSLSQLEACLQTPLRQSPASRFQLTPAGLAFLQQARDLKASLQQLESRFSQLSEPLSGTISLAWQSAVSMDFLPASLASFMQAHPQVFLSIHCETDINNLTRDLSRGHLDLAIADSPPPDPQILTVGSRRSPFVIVSAPRPVCHWSALSYAVPSQPGPHQRRPRWDEQRYPRRIACTSDSLDVLLDWALSGRAATYLPQLTVQSLLDQGRLTIVAQPPEPAYKELFVCSSAAASERPVVKALLKALPFDPTLQVPKDGL